MEIRKDMNVIIGNWILCQCDIDIREKSGGNAGIEDYRDTFATDSEFMAACIKHAAKEV